METNIMAFRTDTKKGTQHIFRKSVTEALNESQYIKTVAYQIHENKNPGS